MKITLPDTEIELYVTGFSNDEMFDLSETSKNLSYLVENIEDPLVIALDGQWGTGKSYFLKRWVGSHTIQNKGKATTVYFDAFEHDYLNDPLISLTSAISGRVENHSSKPNTWRKVKTAAAKLRRPALRVTANVATGGLMEIAGPIVDIALDAGNDELQRQTETFWKKEDGRIGAMHQFRAALSDFTAKDAESTLVIVIDELDRCRPDFALTVLEVIKHFFKVPNVHFVLGVNISELQNIVKSRYGIGTNSLLYLEKFISVTFSLPNHVITRSGRASKSSLYALRAARQMNLDPGISEIISEYIADIEIHHSISIRSTQRILTKIALTPFEHGTPDSLADVDKILVAGLVCQYVIDPNLYKSPY